EFCKTGSVEIDAVVLHEIRVLSGHDSAGFEPDLALRVVDEIDVADDPLAFGDLIFHAAGYAVVEIKMLPAVALAGPHDFFSVVDIVAITASAGESGNKQVVVEKRLSLLVDHRTGLAGVRVDFDYAINLVAPLIVFEGERAAILPPHGRREAVSVGKQRMV